MSIDIVRAGQVTIAMPKGALTAASAAEARRTFTASFTSRRTRMVLDLENVSYIDSSGLSVVVDTMKQARAGGGDLKVCGLQPDVRSIFDMTRLGTVIEIHPSREEAVASW
jgi:anti-sigma B factor antagonist